MKAFFWLADRSGVGYYRGMLPAHALANLGHQVAYSDVMPEWVKDPGGVDVIVTQRTCNDGPSFTWQKLARIGQHKLVFEIDDDLWDIEPSNPAYRFYNADRKRNMVANITVADVVTTTNEVLAEKLSRWNRNVVVLPNQVPAWCLEQPAPVQGEHVTVGWAGGSSHGRDFGEVARPLKRVLQRFGSATEFHCVGVDYTDRVASLRGRTRFTGWASDPAAYLRSVDFSVGVAPIRPSTFNDSKSELKLLEFAALGIPSVVSDTGPYGRAVAAGAPALAATDHRSWERLLVDLIQSPTGRAELGARAREWAAGRTIEANAHLWAEAWNSSDTLSAAA